MSQARARCQPGSELKLWALPDTWRQTSRGVWFRMLSGQTGPLAGKQMSVLSDDVNRLPMDGVFAGSLLEPK